MRMMKYPQLENDLFVENRKRFIQHMSKNAMAIFHSNDMIPMSGDQYFPFKQNPDFFALTGIDQEECALILYPDHPNEKMRTILFVRKTNEHIAVWEGHKYDKKQAEAVSGISSIYWMEQFDSMIHAIITRSDVVYLNGNENYRFDSEVPSRDTRLNQKLMQTYPYHQYERAQVICKKLSMIKLDQEIALIQEACDITEKGFRRILQFIKPGVFENEIEAELIHEFLLNKSTGHAYTPIIASGASACILHYNENCRPCKDGDVILMDFAAEYANYKSDLTRSVPVNGIYTNRQKEVYNAVLDTFKTARSLLVSGTSLQMYQKNMSEYIEHKLIDLKLIDKTDIKNQDPRNPAFKKYFMHGLSHHLGLDVHDLSDMYEPLKPGMVLTCEPGIYIPEEGLGIRIENDIVVTPEGNRDLMANIPIEVEEIEELMARQQS